MNWNHFVALVKLRFQLSMNQVKKAGKLNYIISILVMVCVAMFTVSSFFIGALGGGVWFRQATPNGLLITWTVIIGIFLAMWLIGLLVELQQTELMSIDKLLHLPISLRGAFFLNYTSSFVSSSFLMFAPMMLGLAVGMAIARGWMMLIAIPLVIAFLFFVTTLTYQLRGWLSRIMENKRNRGTVVVSITIFIIMLSQVPNLVTAGFRGSKSERREHRQAMLNEFKKTGHLEIEVMMMAGEARPNDQPWLLEQLDIKAAKQLSEKLAQEQALSFDYAMGIVEKVDTYFPPGWLALGIIRADEGKSIPAILGSLALFAMGLASLCFSYRSSMRKYKGIERKRTRKTKVQALDAKTDNFMFKKLPFVSEHISAVAVSGFRGILRSPEAKMVLIMPIVLGMVGGSLLIGSSDFKIPVIFRPLIPVGVITMTMFGLTSLLFNQFGIDRDGFRAFVLAPIKRKDILIGKNLAVAPLGFGISFLLIGAVQIFVPQGFMSLLAALVQLPAVYLLYCILGNFVSIFFPMGIKRGSMQPANPRFIPMLILILGSILGPTLLMLPTALACGIPMLIEATTEVSMGWLFLVLSIIQLAATWIAYLWILNPMDTWLWNRGPKILDVVANIPE